MPPWVDRGWYLLPQHEDQLLTRFASVGAWAKHTWSTAPGGVLGSPATPGVYGDTHKLCNARHRGQQVIAYLQLSAPSQSTGCLRGGLLC